MIIEGKVIKYNRDNINTDEIIPARYLNTSDPDQLASHCMEDLDEDFIKKKESMKAEILLTGANMGCGSSREHLPIAIKHAGIKAVIAPSYARIFFRNSINMGLPIFECKETGFIEEIQEGDNVAINADEGYMENVSKGKKYKIQIMPEFLQDIIKSGGLVPFARKILEG